MLRKMSPVRLAAAGLLLLACVAAVLWLVPSDDYLFLPDEVRRVDPLVEIDGPGIRDDRRRRDGGGIYFVNIVVRRATLLDSLFPSIHDGSTLVPREAVKPPGVSEAARRRANLRQMARSQTIAAAVALRRLGYQVIARPAGVLISAIVADSPAAGRLKPTDVVVAVDGKRVRTPAELRARVGMHDPGERVELTLRDGSRVRREQVRTAADPQNPGRAVMGVLVEQAADIELPFRVNIDSGAVGGPSAGLAFALDVMEELGRDVDRGYRVAATGEIALDGTVSPIGGVKQKAIAARRASVDVFVVPAGENARDARRYADGVRVIPVTSFQQALHALATLPVRGKSA